MSALKEYPDVTARLLTTCTMKSLSTFYYALERSYQNLSHSCLTSASLMRPTTVIRVAPSSIRQIGVDKQLTGPRVLPTRGECPMSASVVSR